MLTTIHIDGDWTARELADVLDSLEALAGYFVDGTIQRFGLQPPNVIAGDGQVTILPNDPMPGHLRIVRFNYASPGSFDLLGVAKIVEQLRLFLEFLIDLWTKRNDRQLDREERHLELAQRKLELIERIGNVQPNTIEFIENDASNSILAAVLERKITKVSSNSSDRD
ncbi:hypothetical protein [uncultured Tateyamaria sp.]|uniref:hypothetical protein n=1 Tax=uncultured Tateyamaria sp. TaxID=455651 RepID=UPI00263787F7|nr:hypothetical protein [uncultured Tateyamaria sp.]